MGLCFPKQCTKDEVIGFTKELIQGYAKGVGWTGVNGKEDVDVEYSMSSQLDQA
jgi:hypothetical protein